MFVACVSAVRRGCTSHEAERGPDRFSAGQALILGGTDALSHRVGPAQQIFLSAPRDILRWRHQGRPNRHKGDALRRLSAAEPQDLRRDLTGSLNATVPPKVPRPCGDSNRQPGKIIARWPGHMAHLDVKKVGRVPDGGGWRVHGRGSDEHRAVDRAKTAGAKRGYVHLHSIVDGFSRLAYTEPLPDEKGATAAAFLARAKVWSAAHGITHIHRVVTDNGACYRSGDFARIVGNRTRHKKTKPFTPQHNGGSPLDRQHGAPLRRQAYAERRTRRDGPPTAACTVNVPRPGSWVSTRT